jgi:predicted dehydrogenase
MPTPASPEAKRYRGAVIGAGGIARQSHLPALQGIAPLRSRVDVVALVDNATDVAPVDGIPLLARREQLHDFAPLDFIDICTPTASHLELTLWGLEQGYHVICEKPVALTRGEADRVADAARANGRIVVPCHQYRYNPVWMKVKAWLASGAIGRWHLAELSVYRLAADPGRGGGEGGEGGDAAQRAPWRGTSAAGRGGVLLDHGTHLIYQLLDIAGLPQAVSAWTGRLRHTAYDVEDTASLRFEYPDRLVTMFFTWAARARENRIRFVGDAGSIEWAGGELRLEQAGGQGERLDYSAELEKTAYHRWFAGLFATFVAALDRDDPRPAARPFLEDIARVASVVEHAYAAARSGATVAIPGGA